MTPEQFEVWALKWITVAGVVGAAALGVVVNLWAKVKAIKERQDRQSQKTGSLETRLTAVAMATPSTPAVPKETEEKLRKSILDTLQEQQRPGGVLNKGTIVLCVLLMLCTSCATNTGDAAKDSRGRATNAALTYAGKFLGRAAVSALMTVASDEIGGRKADYGSAAASGLWASVNAADTAEAVHGIVSAYSGNKAPETAKASASVFQRAVAAGQDARKVIAAIATVVSTASGAPPATPGK